MADFSAPTNMGQMLPAPDLDFTHGLVFAFTTATQSGAIAARAVMLCSTANCWIKGDVNPTATAANGSFYLPAGVVLFIAITPGWKLSVLQDTTGGTLSIMPVLYPA